MENAVCTPGYYKDQRYHSLVFSKPQSRFVSTYRTRKVNVYTSTMKCKIPRVVGQSCDFLGKICGEGLFCFALTQRCHRYAKLGHKCWDPSFKCIPGLVCTSNICTIAVDEGQHCHKYAGRQKAYCCSHDHVCQKRSSKNERCTSHAACAKKLICAEEMVHCVRHLMNVAVVQFVAELAAKRSIFTETVSTVQEETVAQRGWFVTGKFVK